MLRIFIFPEPDAVWHTMGASKSLLNKQMKEKEGASKGTHIWG